MKNIKIDSLFSTDNLKCQKKHSVFDMLALIPSHSNLPPGPSSINLAAPKADSINRQFLHTELVTYTQAHPGKSFTVNNEGRLAIISSIAFFAGQDYHFHHRKVENHIVGLLTKGSHLLRAQDLPLINNVWKRLITSGSQHNEKHLKRTFDPLLKGLNVESKIDQTTPISAIAQALELFPEETRSLVFPAISQIFNDIHHLKDMNEILHRLEEIENTKRQQFVLLVAPFIKCLENGFQRAYAIAVIRLTPLAGQLSSINHLVNIFEGMERAQCIEFFHLLKKISLKKRHGCISLIASMLQNIEEGQKFDIIKAFFLHKVEPSYSIINELRKTFPRKRLEIMQAIIPKLDKSSNPYKMASIINVLNLLPCSEIVRSLHQVKSLFFNISKLYQKKFLIAQIEQVPLKRRATLISLVNAASKDSQDGSERFQIMQILNLMPKSKQTEEVANLIANFYQNGNLEHFKFIANVLTLIAPKHRLKIFRQITTEAYLDRGYFFIFLSVFQDKTIKEDSHNYLFDFLNQATVSPKRHSKVIFKLAENIVTNHIALDLDQDCKLYQLALSIQILVDPKNKHNPYRFWERLRKKVVNERTFPLPKAIGCASIDALSNWKKTKQPSSNDLPKDILPTIFEDLFNELETRIGNLDPETQEKIKDLICVNCFPKGIKFFEEEDGNVVEIIPNVFHFICKLRDNILQKPLLPSLIRAKYAPNTTIASHVYYAFMTAKFFNDQSNELQPGCLLTNRELSLLKFSSLIMQCSIDQLEGLTIWFNQTEMKKYRLHSDQQEKRLEAVPIEDCIDRILPDYEQALNGILQDPKHINDICNRPLDAPISQEVHQVLYLKNRFCKHLRLTHKVTFDPHVGVISSYLLDLDKNLQKAFEKIMVYFASKFDQSIEVLSKEAANQTHKAALKAILKAIANGLINRLQKEINQNVRDGKFSFNTLVEYFKTSKILKEEDDWTPYISLDEETYEFKEITQKGAEAILRHKGLIN